MDPTLAAAVVLGLAWLAAGGPPCSGPQDCSWAGECGGGASSESSACACDPGFVGPRCEALALSGNATATLANVPGAHLRNSSSTVNCVWGGHAVLVNGSRHWIGSAIGRGGGLADWERYSVAAHARHVGHGHRFVLDEVLLNGSGTGWAGGSIHGVYPVRNPRPWPNQTDAWLIFFTGMNVSDPLGSRQVGVLHAAAMEGPWTMHPVPVLTANPNASAPDTSSVSNSAPAFYNDGSGRLLLAYKGLGVEQPSRPPCTDGSGIPCLFIAAADHWAGPYERVTANAGEPVLLGEDPTLWQDRRGAWHMIYEHYVKVGAAEHCGGHAFSATGLRAWQSTPPDTWYTTGIRLDGVPTTLQKRERPQLVFDDQGRPATLFNGACTDSGSPSGCFNIAMDVLLP